jgi:hypothetical protein
MPEKIEVTNNKEVTEEIIQKNLLAPLFMRDKMKNMFKKIGTKIWQLAHYTPKINWLSLITLIVLISCVVFVATFWKWGTKNGVDISSEKFNIISRIDELKKSHSYYYKVSTKEEKLVKWITLFSDWKYKTDGNFRDKNADCVGAVYLFLQKFNSNVQLETVSVMLKRAQNLAERGELDIRKSPNQIQSGDLIFLKVSETNQHVGIVYDVCGNGLIRYVDMGVGTMTWDLGRIQWGNPWISAVTEISFPFWLGNLISELNTK